MMQSSTLVAMHSYMLSRTVNRVSSIGKGTIWDRSESKGKDGEGVVYDAMQELSRGGG